MDAGLEVASPYVPAYRADHTYQLVIDTGLVNPLQLHFGTGNGIFADNSGSHSIKITQLSVPDAGSSLILLGLGVVGLGAVRRRLT